MLTAILSLICFQTFVGYLGAQKTLKACPSYLTKTDSHMIDYSILDDYEYDLWQTKYGVYKGYKGKQQNNFFAPNQQSNLYPEPVLQQRQHPFQQRQGPFQPRPYPDTTTMPGTTETTTEAPEPVVLEVWKLKLPLSARKVYVIPAVDENDPEEEPIAPFEITYEDLKDNNKTERKQGAMTQAVDITLNELKLNRWYVICMELAINSGDKGGPCLHCEFQRACKAQYGCSNDLFVVEAPFQLQTTSSAILIYTFREFPVTVTSITIDVLRNPKDTRCEESISTNPVSQKVLFWPAPDSIAEISIDGLKPLDKYNVFSHLLFQLPSNSFNLPKSFLINNYAKAGISKCDDTLELKLVPWPTVK